MEPDLRLTVPLLEFEWPHREQFISMLAALMARQRLRLQFTAAGNA